MEKLIHYPTTWSLPEPLHCIRIHWHHSWLAIIRSHVMCDTNIKYTFKFRSECFFIHLAVAFTRSNMNRSIRYLVAYCLWFLLHIWLNHWNSFLVIRNFTPAVCIVCFIYFHICLYEMLTPYNTLLSIYLFAFRLIMAFSKIPANELLTVIWLVFLLFVYSLRKTQIHLNRAIYHNPTRLNIYCQTLLRIRRQLHSAFLMTSQLNKPTRYIERPLWQKDWVHIREIVR